MSNNPAKTSYSRVWTIKYRAGHGHSPTYQSFARAGAPDHSLGDVSKIQVPSADQPGKFEEIGVTRGEEDRPTMDLIFRYKMSLSDIAQLVKIGCPIDAQIHFGQCKTPTNFNGGWEKILVFETAYFTNYSLGDLGALAEGEDATVDETVSLSGQWFYEVVPITLVERAKTDVGQEIIAIVRCGNPVCGECDNPTDGCSIVMSISAPGAGSPGLKAEVIYTEDGYSTSGDTWIDTLDIGEDPTDAACIADNLVVISNDSLSLHYADITDILDGSETWTEVATGFVAGNGPNAIYALNAANIWIIGDNGYVYFTDDPTSGVSVQDNGGATTENLNDVDAYDSQHAVAVGANNTVIYTVDGTTWGAVTGPDTVNTPDLLSVAMHSERVWFVGTDDNAVWVTKDSGVTWEQSRFPGDTESGGGTGSIHKILFLTNSVGILSHETSAPQGRLLRTISGGDSWYVLPEGPSSIPANDRINDVTGCYKDANTIYAGGLADNAADGIIIKGVGN